MEQFKELWKKPLTRIVIMVFSAFICVCCCLTWLIATPDSEGTLPSTASAPTALSLETMLPTAPPQPTSTLPPVDELEKRIAESLGTGNRSIPRLTTYFWDETTQTLFVQFSINDDILESFIVTGIQTDITDILETVDQSELIPNYTNVTIVGTFVLVDKFGNEKEDIVITVSYDRSTVDRINWDNFLYTNILGIADETFIHPALQQIINNSK